MSKRKAATPGARVSTDAQLALDLFDRTFAGPSWRAWRARLCAVLGVPMSAKEAAIFRACTARQALPTAPAREVWDVVSRRAGKSRMAGFMVAVLAGCRRYRLAPGEKGIVSIHAPSKAQCKIVLDYADAVLRSLPALDRLIVRRTADAIDLSNGISIQIQAASFRTPRGYTIVGAVCEEIAFWRDETGANPDREILRALRPSLASVPGSLLVAISSPYSQRGVLYETFDKHFGRDDDDVLVWRAASKDMNPELVQRLIDKAIESDPSGAASEWLGLFRADLETLFTRAALDAVVVPKRFELLPMAGLAYVGFIDPSGGSSDSFTLSIAHQDAAGRPILDLVREVRPPFKPEAVCQQFARELQRYGVASVFSDAYAAGWPIEQFAKVGITVQASPLTRSELYLELLPAVNSGAVELLDDARLLNQLSALERRTGRSGKDAIDHRRDMHDDVANAAAGALVMVARSVDLRAAWPVAFTECVNFEATAGQTCVLLSRGSRLPADPHCRKYCAGFKAASAAYQAHQKAGGALPIAEFIDQQFESNRFTGGFKQTRIEEWLGI